MLEVVKGSAGGPEADVGGGGAGLGDERRQGAPRIAEAGLGNAPVSDLAAVERAVVLRELRVRQPGVEIAEQCLVPVPVDAQEERALAVDVADRRGVVAIDGIVPVRIKLPEHTARILALEIVRQVVELVFGGVELRGDQVFSLDLGFQIEGQASIDL